MTVAARRMRRERWAVVGALGAITVLAWAYLAGPARQLGRMGAMDDAPAMPGMSAVTEFQPWRPEDFGLTLAMWVVMMIGMMVPSVMPTTLLFAGIVRRARREGSPLPPTFVFVAGYSAVWAAFSVAATTAQWALERSGLLSHEMAAASARFGGSLLIAAGIYELSPLKGVCLRRCRAPTSFLMEHWRSSTAGVAALGARAGVYCLGCCWVLMALLFVGGVMNLLWVALIAAFVLVEKVVPFGAATARAAGGALVVAGAVMIGTA